MHRDHPPAPHPATRHHERKEWGPLADDRHERDDERHDRSSWKAHRAYGARREEAGRQIRELRSRY